MAFSYERIAGQSAERLAALSDGIFAVAMTLLVLDLRVPPAETFADERALAGALLELAPHLLIYLMSFITLGIFWVGQQTQINHLARSSRGLTWTHLVFLFFVTIMPFSTRLLAEHSAARTALLFYWGNLVLLGAALYVSWSCATGVRLVKADVPEHVAAAICRRILVFQGLYAFGALLSLAGTVWSIGFIVLVQLYAAFGPGR